jgi:hypothetical protein
LEFNFHYRNIIRNTIGPRMGRGGMGVRR